MTIKLKSTADIEKMRVAGRLAAEVLEMVGKHIKPGVTTEELNTICHDYIVNKQKAVPAPLDYKGFPKSICTSVNEVVCHGIPSASHKLKNSDIINVDVTVIKDGYHGDTSKMFFVGKTSNNPKDNLAKKLVKVSQECLYDGIRQVRPGATLNQIAMAIEKNAFGNKFSIVHEYCGHGIGLGFHEEPQVLHYVNPDNEVTLQEGMTFTIEPMINTGKRHVKLKKDGWTVLTKDGQLSAQWEHTILVTKNGYEVLTLREEERGLI